jgi:hypothetical protein
MTVEEILKSAIAAAGGDGLCNSDLECGCGVDDLAPCDAMGIDCVIAKGRVLGEEEEEKWYGPGDVLMEPVDTEADNAISRS